MPRLLRDRFRRECIAEFRAAAHERFDDAEPLQAAGRRSAAIYLYGYSAEMLLKAACFSAAGFTRSQQITLVDLSNVRQLAKRASRQWPGNLHDISAWANSLVNLRAGTAGLGYPDPAISRGVQTHSRNIARVWKRRSAASCQHGVLVRGRVRTNIGTVAYGTMAPALRDNHAQDQTTTTSGRSTTA